ncbi:MAG TPA: YsnF/AvaK domain-containing protein [Ktedonobacteraceae bacterium]|nr:YsnF/AvaK domain-containing protein [Ktedonobacteraceae bacterium]
MATSDNAIVFGVFRDRALAKQAIDELRHAGFRDDEIRLVGGTTGTGGLLNHVASTITGHDPNEGQFPEDIESKGVPSDEVNYYRHEVEAGRTVVVVESYGHQQEARTILYHHGAYDASNQASQATNERIIPVREEELHVQKQLVETGEVIVRKEIITEEKTFTVPVTREELVIERFPGSTQSSDLSSYEDEDLSEALIDGGTLRIVLREERVHVEKQTVVKEEIFISKRQIQETQHIEETLRKEEAHIERVGDVNIHGAEAEEVPREV